MTSALAGWPDRASLTADGWLSAFDAGGCYRLPVSLALAHDGDRPRVHLELFRRDDAPDETDAVLEAELELTGAPLEPDPAAPADRATPPPPWSDGWLMVVAHGIDGFEATSAGPIEPNGASGMRFAHHLALDSALVFADSIASASTARVEARADLAVPAVASRAAGTVRFDPAVVVGALAARASASAAGCLSRDEIASILHAEASALGISGIDEAPPGALTATDPLASAAAVALADRLIGRFGALARPARLDAPAGFVFSAAAAADFTWDLAEPAPTLLVATARGWPLAALDGFADRASLIVRSTIPRFDLGGRYVRIRSCLPDNLVGIDLVRARLVLPSIAKLRPQAQVREALLVPDPEPGGSLVGFRSGPGLPSTYQRRTLAAISGTAEVLVSEPADSDRPVAIFTVADLPVVCAPIAATDDLLAQGDVAVHAELTRAGEAHVVDARLTRGAPRATIAIPPPDADADADAALTLTLCETGGPGVVALGRRPFGPLVIDRSQVPTSGSQHVTIAAELAGADLLAIELRPDDPSSPTAPETVSFTTTSTSRTWTYTVVDPFRSGVRYRVAGAGDAPAGEWSEPHDPVLPLVVRAALTRATERA